MSIKLTFIARTKDGLILVSGVEEDGDKELADYKKQAKSLLSKLSNTQETRCSINSSPHVFHYIIEKGVTYMCLCDRNYPRKLAFSFLEDLEKEFRAAHGEQVASVTRPYAFIKFETFITKSKKSFKDSKSHRNVSKLNDDLQDVTRVMTRSIHDFLDREEKLSNMSTLSSQLLQDSKKYLVETKNLKLAVLYRTYGPPAFVVLVVLAVLYVRFYYF